jgi:hypothetical protein
MISSINLPQQTLSYYVKPDIQNQINNTDWIKRTKQLTALFRDDQQVVAKWTHPEKKPEEWSFVKLSIILNKKHVLTSETQADLNALYAYCFEKHIELLRYVQGILKNLKIDMIGLARKIDCDLMVLKSWFDHNLEIEKAIVIDYMILDLAEKSGISVCKKRNEKSKKRFYIYEYLPEEIKLKYNLTSMNTTGATVKKSKKRQSTSSEDEYEEEEGKKHPITTGSIRKRPKCRDIFEKDSVSNSI